MTEEFNLSDKDYTQVEQDKDHYPCVMCNFIGWWVYTRTDEILCSKCIQKNNEARGGKFRK